MPKHVLLSLVGLTLVAGSLKGQDFAQPYSGPLSSVQLYERLETQDSRIRDLESRYSFVETIATGGMKKVNRVYDARADRYVAMAQLLDDAEPELYEPFLREACLTARMEHPNIVSIYNIGVDGAGHPFFTMELKVGDSLSAILKKLSKMSRRSLTWPGMSCMKDVNSMENEPE